ncbi:hypothetical protein MHI43_16420 [Paenibacillus sp. FSL H8-0457]|uniref:hypothetical protein n=1 Tax=Paenibacillus sp. FSL H8-0457 TaxID=2921386 RepID=UPI00310147FD
MKRSDFAGFASAHFLTNILRIIGEKHPGLTFELHEGRSYRNFFVAIDTAT